MPQVSQSLDYTAFGFDSFLDRSIGKIPTKRMTLENIAPAGGMGRNINFDQAQTSGRLGDVIQVGNIYIDGKEGRIILNDNNTDVLLLGKDKGGF